MSKTIKIDVRLPTTTLQIVDTLAEQKILGETRADVIMHILRQYVFERSLAFVPPAKKRKV